MLDGKKSEKILNKSDFQEAQLSGTCGYCRFPFTDKSIAKEHGLEREQALLEFFIQWSTYDDYFYKILRE